MKKLIVVLIAAFSIITACMIYLIKEGVSLRLGRVVEPTLMSLGEGEIARALVSRLTAIFQPSKFVVIGLDRQDPQMESLLKALANEYERVFNVSPALVEGNSNFLESCKGPCWIISNTSDSNHLQSNTLNQSLQQSGATYFAISFLRFKRDIEVPKHCEQEKRITIDCVTPLAVREAKRKFKEKSRYFFVRNYNEQDYFVFLEQ